MSNVDSLDRSILSFLRESARAPYVEIAKGVGSQRGLSELGSKG
ncbi:MAG: hypothetical protein Ct9H90mP1_2300 [Methanobacteriota archaeon]|nr:MAG: hypothetical protein Ct9H90mP1_2300 [Euryarchaeota archaeon]